MVASTGGPLAELVEIEQRLAVRGDRVEWATGRSAQTGEMLSDQVVHHVAPVFSRDVRGLVHNLPLARRLLREREVTRVIACGAGVALPFVAVARRLGIETHYVESAARVDRPSLTGALVARVPGVRLHTQHVWPDRRWRRSGSVFDAYLSTATRPAERIDRVVVTLGAQRGFSFRRAVEALVQTLPEVTTSSPTVLWQTGATDTVGTGIDAHAHVPRSDLAHAIAEADLVVSHGGVGSALLSLQGHRVPVLLPRLRAYAEHADDHQVRLADHLEARGLGVHVAVDGLSPEALVSATARSAMAGRPPAFDLVAGARPAPVGATRAALIPLQRTASSTDGDRTGAGAEPAATGERPVRS